MVNESLQDWLTTREAARLGGVSDKRILQLVRDGRLETRRLGRPVLVSRRDVASWAASRHRPSGWRPLSLRDLRFKRAEMLGLARRHGAAKLRVFGSMVDGGARSDSDVDLLVDLDDDRGALDLAELATDLEDLLGCRVDLVATRGNSAFVARLLAVAEPL